MNFRIFSNSTLRCESKYSNNDSFGIRQRPVKVRISSISISLYTLYIFSILIMYLEYEENT